MNRRNHFMFAVVVSVGVALGVSSYALAQTDEDTRPITKLLNIDRSFRIDLSNDCIYSGDVRGTIQPSRTTVVADAVSPKLMINADLQCTASASLRVTGTIASTIPMTRAALEEEIERQGRLTGIGPNACVYTPDFNLSNAGLNLRAVSSRCPTARTSE